MVTLPTKILPKSILDSVKKSRPIYNAGRRARFALGSRLGARYVEALGSKAHYNDFMLSSTAHDHVESYRRGAVDFVDILGTALKDAGHRWADIRSCLEVGCGYGRIVRELRREVPARAISVCDMIDEAARFTASEFGVQRVPLVELTGPERNGSHDMVYLLSVYTHLDRPMIEMNLAKVAALTRLGGIVVFTTHGRRSAQQAERYDQYWLDKTKLNAELDRTGFFYERYPYYYAEYGLTWITGEKMQELVAEVAPELEFVSYYPAAVDGHQDVFVYRKV
jgi:SAM-dependent methyltransferase